MSPATVTVARCTLRGAVTMPSPTTPYSLCLSLSLSAFHTLYVSLRPCPPGAGGGGGGAGSEPARRNSKKIDFIEVLLLILHTFNLLSSVF